MKKKFIYFAYIHQKLPIQNVFPFIIIWQDKGQGLATAEVSHLAGARGATSHSAGVWVSFLAGARNMIDGVKIENKKTLQKIIVHI